MLHLEMLRELQNVEVILVLIIQESWNMDASCPVLLGLLLVTVVFRD